MNSNITSPEEDIESGEIITNESTLKFNNLSEKKIRALLTRLNRFPLRVISSFPEELEANYLENRLYGNLFFVQFAIFLGCGLLFATQIIEYFVVPSNLRPEYILEIRIPVIIALITAGLITRSKLFLKYHQQIIGFCVLIAVLAVLVGAVLYDTEPFKTLNYLLIVIAELICFLVLPLRPVYSWSIGISLALLSIFCLIYVDNMPIEYWIPVGGLVVGGTLVALILALRLERLHQINYLQNISITLEKVKLNQLNSHLKGLASTDPLTGIANRREFETIIKNEWNRAIRNGAPLGLLIIDIDNFKAYNDTYGHQKGDLCLIEIAESFSELVKRSGETVVRFGGEEFVIIVPNCNEESLLKLGHNICQAVRDLEIPHSHSSVSNLVTCSIGAASWVVRVSDTQKSFIDSADLALYRAKTRGKDQVSI